MLHCCVSPPVYDSDTFQIASKTYQVMSHRPGNTFHLLVPTLSRSYIMVPKLCRSVPLLSKSQYLHLPTSYVVFIFKMAQNFVKTVNSATRCKKQLIEQISVENTSKSAKDGKKCDFALTTASESVNNRT